MRNISLFVVALLAWCAITSSASAQNIQFTQGNVGSGLDATLQIPLRAYPGRGAASLPITLYYSSKVWRISPLNTVNNTTAYQTIAEAIYAEFSTAGWQTSLDIPKIEWPKQTDGYFYSGGPYNFAEFPNGSPFRVARVYIHMPDGSTHELRKSDQPYQGPIDMQGTFYAVDGSRMRYDSTGASTGTLYLPDGTRYILNGSTAQYIDRNGNTLNYDSSTRKWTDILGREIGIPLPANPLAQLYTYTLPGINGDLTYQFRWQHLSETGVITPVNGQTPSRKAIAREYLPNPNQLPTNQTGGNYPVMGQAASLFVSDAPEDAATLTLVVGRGQHVGELFDPVVLTEVIYPNGLSYKFTYNIYGEIDKIVYPTGGFERYEYNQVEPVGETKTPYTQTNRAVTKRQLSADGTSNNIAEWQYSVSKVYGDASVPAGTLLTTTTAPDGTLSKVYQHSLFAPGHGRNDTPYWSFGHEDPLNGMIFDERVYAPVSQGGAMLRRKLTAWERTTNPVPPRTNLPGDVAQTAYRNPRSNKEVSFILDTGGDALAKTLTYSYDTLNQLTTGVDLTVATESYFDNVNSVTAQTGTLEQVSPGMSTGTLASSAETTYISDPNGYYHDRNILGLAASIVLKDANGQAVSKTETFYDEAALQSYNDLNSVPGVTDWTDPGTKRGNVTRVRHYINAAATAQPDQECPAGVCLETHAYFDQVGNVWKVNDVRGIESQTEYSATYKHAYPTLATTADPDGTGPKTALTTASVYDPTTGLVTSTTDANGLTITLSYADSQNVTDPLNRLRKITRPDGSFTSYDYHDSANDIASNGIYVETKSTLDTGRTTISRQYFDKLGRSVRAFAFENTDPAAPWLASDTRYDQLGRVSQVSNAYRTLTPSATLPSSCSLCTTSTYDALGRVAVITLPDATTVQTSYQGIYTTVTDQAGKQRRQKVDALGRIVRVDEPNAGGSLGTVEEPAQATYYYYNTQGNLVHVQQGAGTEVQHRYFKYDSLNRLTYEFHVEPKAAPFTTSDANTPSNPTANTIWTRKLVYDETLDSVSYKGLLTSMTDARNIRTEYRYDNLNRSTRVSYNDSVTPAVNYFYDEARYTYTGEDRTIYNKGRLAEVQTEAIGSVPATSQAYNYDLMGRVANNRQTVGTNSYTMLYRYYTGGALKSEQYPSGRVVSYAYDDAARLNGVSSGATNYESNYQYGPKGLLTSVNLGNGAVESYDYNDRLQLKELGLTKDGNTLQRYVYKYGQVDSSTWTLDETKNNGQIAQIDGYIGSAKQWQQKFGYDSLGRLKAAAEYQAESGPRTYLINYDYDRFNNRYQKLATNPATDNPLGYVRVEDGNISKSTNRFLFPEIEYDDAGNITTDGKFRARKYQYDANNRQRSVSLIDNTGAATSVYDGAGERVATIANGTTSYMVYDAMGKLVAEYGQVASATSGTSYVFSDHQGSTRVVMSQTSGGQMSISRHDYQPFGEEIYSGVGLRSTTQGYDQSDSARQKYAGMEKDEGSGMAHTLWRKYDAMSGRWTSPDPYGGSMSISSPQSFNRYSYVNNDPVNQTDPSGLIPASQGWNGASAGFWGSDYTGGGSHFGGPEAIGQGLLGYAGRVEGPLAVKRSEEDKANGDDDPPIDPDDVVRIFIWESKQWQQCLSYDSLDRLSQASEYRGGNNQQSHLINYDYDRFNNRYQYQANALDRFLSLGSRLPFAFHLLTPYWFKN
jgi:RHS repeat-associated protein